MNVKRLNSRKASIFVALLISAASMFTVSNARLGVSTAAQRAGTGNRHFVSDKIERGSSLGSNPVQSQFPPCSYKAAMPGYGYQILPQPAPVTRRQQALFDWFSPWAIARNPLLQYMRFPVLVLEGERNARAGSFGIAINPQWFSELDEDVTIGIYAHELGHVSQAYGLIPLDGLARQHGVEGQADYFAGTLLKASGQFSPAQMQKFIDWVMPSAGDQTHAPGRVRADLMRAGYANSR